MIEYILPIPKPLLKLAKLFNMYLQPNDIVLGRKIDESIDNLPKQNTKKRTLGNRRSKIRSHAFIVHDKYNACKYRLISNLFWGRSNYYKNLLHSIIILMTALVVVSNLAAKISSVTESKNSTFAIGNNINGTDDLLVQGGNITTVLTQEATGMGLRLIKHTVEEGDTLDSVAAEYGVTPDTIQWASSDIMNPFSTKIEAGWVLTIPEGMNGVLYYVKKGQTLDNIIAETSITNNEANRFNIIEFNQLNLHTI